MVFSTSPSEELSSKVRETLQSTDSCSYWSKLASHSFTNYCIEQLSETLNVSLHLFTLFIGTKSPKNKIL